jgi:hypothetical protein
MYPAFGGILILRILASCIMLHEALPYGLTESMRLYLLYFAPQYRLGLHIFAMNNVSIAYDELVPPA